MLILLLDEEPGMVFPEAPIIHQSNQRIEYAFELAPKVEFNLEIQPRIEYNFEIR